MPHDASYRDRPRIDPPYRHRQPLEYLQPDEDRAISDFCQREAWREGAEYCQALTYRPNPPLEIWFLIGMFRRREKQYEQAEAAVAYVLAREPGYGAAWHMLSRLQLEQYAYDDALRSVYMAISLMPRFIIPWLMLAKIYQHMGHLEAARLARDYAWTCSRYP